ncbi:uncharacterized protein LOC117478220 [Trematomus bernacchii]|uniref:uncharacterized protein LOC117478220 n=1 Tax=Trematomus bernacchii TaxID=40690 RepID=UPI00146C1E3C|nr:uncharacterized protein LOC117478220 [Trematomus bernacchii]
MADSLVLEALSALSGCSVERGASTLTPQDFVNIVALKEYYKQEGFKTLEYPSLGSLSLHDLDGEDLYSSPPALTEGPQESHRTKLKINPEDFFHPQYDYDFSNIKDGNKAFLRGGEPYIRPCGWKRFALRVTKKYDDDVWLGKGTDSWPVSYHAKNMDGSLGVILSHGGNPEDTPQFLDAAAASLVTGETRGQGVYSTPDIKMAEKYCRRFKSKVDGKTYKVVLQNRINPEKRKECQRENTWLVYVPKDCSDVEKRAMVQESIRPYGLLLRQA